MTRFKAMTMVSVLALMASYPAHAADVSATAVSGDAAVPATASHGRDAISDAADDIKAFFIGKNPDDKLEPVLIHRSLTAHGLIGETIVNIKGEKVATVKDIIVDKDGKAALVVVSDGGLLGIGSKVAAFDYNKVVGQKTDGKVVMTLSQYMVDHASDFSYDQRDWAKAKVIPTGSISVNQLLEGGVLDDNGTQVADIENVYFRNADVSQIIVGFDKKFGMGGDLAALDYNDLQMVKKDQSLDFKLTANQAEQFKSFKKSVAN